MTNLLELDDGVTVTYEVVGEGVPILGLPGGPGIAAGYVASFAAGLTDALAWHLIDPPGTGGSTRADDYSIDAHVLFYREVASALGLDRYLVFGHSYSGTVASTFAARHPDRVRGCLLAAPPVVGVEPDMAEGGGIRAAMNALMARHEGQPWYAEAVKAEFEPDLSDPVGSMLRGLRLYFSDPDDELFEATLAAIGPIEVNFDAVVSFYEKEWRPLDLRPLLPTIPCPLLAVVGEHDWAVPPVQARYYEELVPDGRTVEIPNCGHWLQVEAPATWRATVRDWLTDVLQTLTSVAEAATGTRVADAVEPLLEVRSRSRPPGDRLAIADHLVATELDSGYEPKSAPIVRPDSFADPIVAATAVAAAAHRSH